MEGRGEGVGRTCGAARCARGSALFFIKEIKVSRNTVSRRVTLPTIG